MKVVYYKDYYLESDKWIEKALIINNDCKVAEFVAKLISGAIHGSILQKDEAGVYWAAGVMVIKDVTVYDLIFNKNLTNKAISDAYASIREEKMKQFLQLKKELGMNAKDFV